MIVHIFSSCLHKCKLDKHFFHVGVVVACVVLTLVMQSFHGILPWECDDRNLPSSGCRAQLDLSERLFVDVDKCSWPS